MTRYYVMNADTGEIVKDNITSAHLQRANELLRGTVHRPGVLDHLLPVSASQRAPYGYVRKPRARKQPRTQTIGNVCREVGDAGLAILSLVGVIALLAVLTS